MNKNLVLALILLPMIGLAALGIKQSRDPAYMARYKGISQIGTYDFHVPQKCFLPVMMMMGGHLQEEMNAWDAKKIWDYVEACGGKVEKDKDIN